MHGHLNPRTFKLLFWGGVSLAICSLLYFISNNEPAFVNPKIEAEKFVWPEGCEQKQYKKFDEIKADCLTHYIGNGRNYGWSRHKSGPNKYFRIENDALNVT